MDGLISLSGNTIAIALIGGISPALFWLWFWLREDTVHPEPRGLIVLAFLAGMFVAPFALFPEQLAASWFGLHSVTSIVIWAVIEESLKLLAAYIGALHSKLVDEPIDPLMYMITAAIGFSATENILFLLAPLHSGHFSEALMLGSQRFIGASLLHIICSAVIGLFLATSFHISKPRKVFHVVSGLFLAIALHALFNLHIIGEQGTGVFVTFSVVWFAAILLMLAFEKVKQMR